MLRPDPRRVAKGEIWLIRAAYNAACWCSSALCGTFVRETIENCGSIIGSSPSLPLRARACTCSTYTIALKRGAFCYVDPRRNSEPWIPRAICIVIVIKEKKRVDWTYVDARFFPPFFPFASQRARVFTAPEAMLLPSRYARYNARIISERLQPRNFIRNMRRGSVLFYLTAWIKKKREREREKGKEGKKEKR